MSRSFGLRFQSMCLIVYEQTEKELDETKEKLQERSFGSHVIRDNKQRQHYTGFPAFKRYQACLNF